MGDSRLVKGVACFWCSRAVRKPYFIHDVRRIRRQVRLRNFNILGFTVAFNTFFLSFSKGGSRFVNFRQRLSFRGLLAAAAIFAAVPLNASANNDQAGVVVSARGGEEVRRAGSQRWQPVKVRVALFPGDRVRTGRYGGLSILLTDETQMRLHPGSDLVVVQVRKDSQSESSSLRLLAGSLWSRARSLFRGLAGRINRGRGNSVSVSTPTATIGIRGTDWHVHIDSDGHTHLTVISGEGEIANGSGAIAVRSGEVGSARVDGGKPASRQVVSLKARPLIALDLSYDWLDLLKLTPHRHTVLHAAHKYVSSIEDAFRAYDLGHLQDIEDWLSKQSLGLTLGFGDHLVSIGSSLLNLSLSLTSGLRNNRLRISIGLVDKLLLIFHRFLNIIERILHLSRGSTPIDVYFIDKNSSTVDSQIPLQSILDFDRDGFSAVSYDLIHCRTAYHMPQGTFSSIIQATFGIIYVYCKVDCVIYDPLNR